MTALGMDRMDQMLTRGLLATGGVKLWLLLREKELPSGVLADKELQDSWPVGEQS